MQRVRVGVIGLAAVLLIIGISAMIFSIVNRERPVAAIGAPKVDVAANLTISNTEAPGASGGEPLAELGVAPNAGPSPAATPNPEH